MNHLHRHLHDHWGKHLHERMHAMGRGHGGHGGHGPFGGPFGDGFGFGWGGGGGRRRGRGGRARRGDVRAAILALLAEEPRNGYQIMQELEQRSQGLWRPSSGSIYPALQQLEDEGLVREQEGGTGRVFELTDAGRQEVEGLDEEQRTPWEAATEDAGDEALDLMSAFKSTAAAAMQVFRAGTAAQREEAKKILLDARRAFYRLLADEPPERTKK
ncbi:MAG: helix-turn-helix transcriptional regulator [Deltaproteobacteria bacterium]|nr:helix-turn-helix transcriptional regulator [Deltaproteobacteria bacterium]